MSLGAFITVEGIDGCGKTTQADFIEKYLTEQGITVVRTREPGGTDFGDGLREVLLNPEIKIDDVNELIALFISRRQHLTEKITPALKRGDSVLCERFTDSTYAYQGGGREMDDEIIRDWESKILFGKTEPDLTLLLDVPPEIGRERVSKRAPSDRFEKEPLEFSDAVRAAYLFLAKKSKDRIRKIDATGSPDEVSALIKTELDAFQREWK